MHKPAIHAGFLNFQPFPDYPEFHASYKLKNNMVYSDKFHLNVIDLTHINLSTDTDKEYQLDIWAKFFTAQTWEEVIMLANNAELKARLAELETRFSELEAQLAQQLQNK